MFQVEAKNAEHYNFEEFNVQMVWSLTRR